MSIAGKTSSEKMCECGHKEVAHYKTFGTDKGSKQPHIMANRNRHFSYDPFYVKCECMDFTESFESLRKKYQKIEKRKQWEESQREWHERNESR